MKNGCNTDLGIWTILGNCGTALLNSRYSNSGYTKQIHKHTRNKMAPVSIVFYCVFKKYWTKNVRIRIEEVKYYGEIAVSSLLNSIFNNVGYTNHIHKRTRNKIVLVCIVFYRVFQK